MVKQRYRIAHDIGTITAAIPTLHRHFSFDTLKHDDERNGLLKIQFVKLRLVALPFFVDIRRKFGKIRLCSLAHDMRIPAPSIVHFRHIRLLDHLLLRVNPLKIKPR